MLKYRPFAVARSFAAKRRPLATRSFLDGGNDQLNDLLGVPDSDNSSSSASLWGSGNSSPAPVFPENDPSLQNPPQAPEGSLPPGSSPSPRAKKSLHQLPEERHYHLHVFASRNNTILTLTDVGYRPRYWVSAGACGFKKVQRSGYEAGYQCAVRMFKRIEELKTTSPMSLKLDVAFRGFGFGREAVFRALMASEGEAIRDTVTSLKDATRLKIGGGTKAKKMRRL